MEYKIVAVTVSTGEDLSRGVVSRERLENTLNQYAREGWRVRDSNMSGTQESRETVSFNVFFLLEREVLQQSVPLAKVIVGEKAAPVVVPVA